MSWTRVVNFAIEALSIIFNTDITGFNLDHFLSLLRTIFLVLLFSQYARNVKFPLPIYKSKKGWTAYKLQLFKMFPVSSHLFFFFFGNIAFGSYVKCLYEKRGFKQVVLGGPCLCDDTRVLMTTQITMDLKFKSSGSFQFWSPFSSMWEGIGCPWNWGRSDSKWPFQAHCPLFLFY